VRAGGAEKTSGEDQNERESHDSLSSKRDAARIPRKNRQLVEGIWSVQRSDPLGPRRCRRTVAQSAQSSRGAWRQGFGRSLPHVFSICARPAFMSTVPASISAAEPTLRRTFQPHAQK